MLLLQMKKNTLQCECDICNDCYFDLESGDKLCEACIHGIH